MAQTISLQSQKQRDVAKSLIDLAPSGAVVTIRLSKRTSDQNAYLWSLISDVSRAKPEGRTHTPEVWKALFMAACGHMVQFEAGIDGGPPFPVGFRSSRMTKKEMSDLIEFIIEYGTRHGVAWIGPEEAQNG